MALTNTVIGGRAESMGSKRFAIVNVAFDSSYPTGGESLLPADVGFQTFDLVLAEPSAGYTFEYDHATSKLLARRGDNDNAGDAPSVEVANTVDLSGVTGVRVLVIGTV